jgi:hypothetical protein
MLKFEVLNFHDQDLTLDHYVEMWEQIFVEDRDRWRALVSAVMNIQFPLNAGNLLSSSEPVSF